MTCVQICVFVQYKILNPGKKAITFRDLDKVDFGLTLQENAPLVELNKTVLLIAM